MATYTTTDFLTSVRMRGSIPTSVNSANVNNTANLLLMGTEELHIKLLPLIMAAREEFYVTAKDYAITANQSAYILPSRASGMVVRDVQIVNGSSIYSLRPVDSDLITTTGTGAVEGYYFQHNNLILYPTPAATSGTLRVRYFGRPSRLAAISACAQISAISAGTSTVTVSTVPSSWSTSTPLDIIKSVAPYYNPVVDQSPTSMTATTITFASLPSDLAVGDWLALAEYSPIPQIPHEFQPLLAQMTVVKALEAVGDREGAKAAKADLDLIQANATQLITPRSHSDPRKVIGRNWR